MEVWKHDVLSVDGEVVRSWHHGIVLREVRRCRYTKEVALWTFSAVKVEVKGTYHNPRLHPNFVARQAGYSYLEEEKGYLHDSV